MSNTDFVSAEDTNTAANQAAAEAAEAEAVNGEAETNEEEDADYATNDQRLNEVFKQAGKFGREAGQGVDALPKLAIVMTTAAMDGVFTDAEGKPIEKDISRKVYKRFVKDFGKKRQYDQSADSENTQVAKLNVFKKLGEQKEFNGEDMMEKIVALYREFAGTELKPKPVYDAYVSAGRVAVKAAKQKTTPTDDELKSAMVRAGRKTRELADIVQGIHKLLDDLITGNRKDEVMCPDQEIVDARNALKTWLTLAAAEQEMANCRATAARLGLVLSN